MDVVQDVDGMPAESHRLGVHIMLRPGTGVDIPSDRSDGRNPPETGDDIWSTDITSMDMCYAGETLLDLRA
jgi:hypothetical protein